MKAILTFSSFNIQLKCASIEGFPFDKALSRNPSLLNLIFSKLSLISKISNSLKKNNFAMFAMRKRYRLALLWIWCRGAIINCAQILSKYSDVKHRSCATLVSRASVTHWRRKKELISREQNGSTEQDNKITNKVYYYIGCSCWAR